MTATLPTFLKNILADTLAKATGIAPHEIQADDGLYQKLKRHQIKILDGEIFDFYDQIRDEISAKKKVLVVCNTVLRAQQIFKELKEETNAILLHGAFNGEDRAKKEEHLKDKENLPQLLIGTQAIEVSLDIDYDVIYTELAPLDALLQRFGRVNRKAPHEIRESKPCYVFELRNEKDKYIYRDTEILQRTLIVLKRVAESGDGVVDERDLQKMLDEVYGDDFSPDDRNTFESVYSSLEGYVDRLVPLMESENAEEDFYKMFDGVKVLPTGKYEYFKERLERFDFIGAELLKVSVRKTDVGRWMSNGILEKSSHILTLSNDKTYEVKYLIIRLAYNEDLGLQKDVEIPHSEAFLGECFF